MKKILILGFEFNVKEKKVNEKIIQKEDAIVFFDSFVKEYTDITDISKIPIPKDEFVDIVLSYNSFSEEKNFIRFYNDFHKRNNTLVGFFMNILLELDYKASELLKLTHSQLFDTFTIELYHKVCKKRESALIIYEQLVAFGIDKKTALTYINNGLPVSERIDPDSINASSETKSVKSETDEMKNIIEFLKSENN